MTLSAITLGGEHASPLLQSLEVEARARAEHRARTRRPRILGREELSADEVHYIVLHCSATRIDRPYSAEALERDHRARGYRRAGYHFYVRTDGTVVPLRPLSMVGAHTLGYNHCSVGVCYEGGLDAEGEPRDTRSLAQVAALYALLSSLKRLYPHAEILGHRDLSPDRNHDGIVDHQDWLKACPCFDARTEYLLITPTSRPISLEGLTATGTLPPIELAGGEVL